MHIGHTLSRLDTFIVYFHQVIHIREGFIPTLQHIRHRKFHNLMTAYTSFEATVCLNPNPFRLTLRRTAQYFESTLIALLL